MTPMQTIQVDAIQMLAMSIVAVSWVRRSGFPGRIFGLSTELAGRHIGQAILWTLPLLLALVGLKWVLVSFVPGFEHIPLSPPLKNGFEFGSTAAYLVYAALVPIQEFLSRGVIQGPMYELLTGSETRRHFWAILVSNTLFAITHLHLTLAYGAAAFVGGIFWGLLYARQRSLVGPIVSHILLGIFALYVLGFADLLKGLS